MSVDIATLGIQVTSSDITTAEDRLNRLTQAGGRAEQATTSLSRSTAELTRLAKLAAEAYAAWKLAKLIEECTILAARVETLSVVLKVVGNNAGYTGAQMEGYVNQVRKMGITTQESMNSLIKMAGAQMDLSKASQLARVAQDAAVIGGINSSEAFGRMIQGIRSGEVEILKTIGINVQFDQAYKQTAQTLGKNVDQLSNTEKTAARLNAVLEFGTHIAGAYEASMGTAGKQITSMSRYIEELKLKIGEAFTPSLSFIIGEITRSLKAMDTQLEHNKDNVGSFGEDFKLALVSIAAEVQRVSMLIDLAGGTLTAFASRALKVAEVGTRFLTIGQFGDWFKEKSEAMARANAMYAQRFAQGEQELQRLANLTIPGATPSNARTKEQEQAALAAAAAQKEKEAADARKAAAVAGAAAAERWRATYSDLRKEIAALNPSLTEQDRALSEVTNKYEDLAHKKGANIVLLKELRGQHLQAISDHYATAAAIKATSEEFKEYLRLAESEAPQHNSAGEMNLRWEEELRTLESLQSDAGQVKLNEQIAEFEKLAEQMPERAGQVAAAIARLKREFSVSSGDIALQQLQIQNQLALVDAAERFNYVSSSDSARARLDLLQKQLDLEKGLLEDIKGATAQDDILRAHKLATITSINRAILEQQTIINNRTAYAGARSALHEYAEDATNTGAQVKNAMLDAFRNMEDALTEFVLHGKTSFHSMVDSMLADIARMAVKQSFTGPLTTLLQSVISGQGTSAASGVVQSSFGVLASDANAASPGFLESITNSISAGAETGTAAGATSGISTAIPYLAVAMAAGYAANSYFGKGGMWNQSSDSQKVWRGAAMTNPIGWGALALDWATGGGLFGTDWAQKQGGLNLGIKDGGVAAQNYVYSERDKSWWRGTDSKTDYSPVSSQLQTFLDTQFKSITDGIAQASRTLGSTTASQLLESFTTNKINVNLAGLSNEDQQKAIADFFRKAASLAVTSLYPEIEKFTALGEDAAAAFARITSSLDAVNKAAALTNNALISTTLASGQAASELMSQIGGADRLAALSDKYAKVTNTSDQYNALKVAAAHREIEAALSGQGLVIPETVAEYKKLVEAQDLSTASGRDLYAKLLPLADAFGTIKDAAQTATDAIKTITDTLFALKTSDTSLSPEARYNATNAQYSADLALAGSGDSAAMSRVVQESLSFLDASKAYYASSKGYQDDFAMVTASLQQLATTAAAANNLPLPKFAGGGMYSGGSAIMGEDGPEFVDSAPGYVYRADETKALFDAAKRGTTGKAKADSPDLKGLLAEARQTNEELRALVRLQSAANKSLVEKMDAMEQRLGGIESTTRRMKAA